MAESKIVALIISLWKTVVCWYEASFISRAINSVCSFFIKNSDGSIAVRAFKHGAFGGKWWTNSRAYCMLCLTFKGRKGTVSIKSSILDSLLDIFNIPLKSIGIILLAYSAVMLAVSFIDYSTLNIVFGAGLLVVALLCLVFSKSLYSLYLGSSLFKFIGGFFYDGEYRECSDRKISIIPACSAAAIIGMLAGAVSPIFVTIAIIGILAASVIVARFEVGVFLVLFLAAFLPTAAVAGLGVLTIIGFAVALFTGRIKNLKPTAIAPLLAIYVLLGIFSTATSFNIPSSAFVFVVYLVFIATYAVIANTLTTTAKWRAAVVTFALSALMIALFGIVQNFTMDATTQSWVDPEMFEDIKIRVYATFDNPNVLGQYFIITIPIIFSLFVFSKKFTQKVVWLSVFAVCFLCLLYTWSRGAWVGVVLGIGVFLLIRDRRWIVLLILAILAMPFVLPESIMNRLLSIGNTGDSSTAYRVSVWIASARMALDYWMSGVGYGSDAFAAVYSSYALNGAGYALHSHNFYIQFIADVGIGGLIAYILIVLTAYREISAVKNNQMIKTVSFALAGTLTGYLFQGVAESLWYNMRMSLMFWIVMAFIISGARLDKEEGGV